MKMAMLIVDQPSALKVTILMIDLDVLMFVWNLAGGGEIKNHKGPMVSKV